MADMNELKDKVVGTLGNVADITKTIASAAADKAKAMGRIAKLTMEINGEKDAIRKAYLEIGKLYYETHRGDPDGFFVQLCDEVALANDSIAAKEKEISELKTVVSDFGGDGDIQVDFEDIVSEGEDSCSCGEEHGEPAAPEEKAETPPVETPPSAYSEPEKPEN